MVRAGGRRGGLAWALTIWPGLIHDPSLNGAVAAHHPRSGAPALLGRPLPAGPWAVSAPGYFRSGTAGAAWSSPFLPLHSLAIGRPRDPLRRLILDCSPFSVRLLAAAGFDHVVVDPQRDGATEHDLPRLTSLITVATNSLAVSRGTAAELAAAHGKQHLPRHRVVI